MRNRRGYLMLDVELAKTGADIKLIMKKEPNLTDKAILKKIDPKLSAVVKAIENDLTGVGKSSISLAKNLFKLHKLIDAPYIEIGRVLEEHTGESISRTFVFKLCKAGQNISINGDLEHLKDIEKHYLISRCKAIIIAEKFSEVGGIIKYGNKNVNKMTREELKATLGLSTKKVKKKSTVTTKDRHKTNINDWVLLTRAKVLDDIKVFDQNLAAELEKLLNRIDSAGSVLAAV